MVQLVAVVGPSGVGKTSLARALRAAYPFNVGLEQHAERPFQSLFKSDARYALANQVDYLLLRAEQERGLRRSAETGLVDGGLDQDFHGFTRLFRARNYLREAEFDLCRRLYETIRASQPPPDLVIALKLRTRRFGGGWPGATESTSPAPKTMSCSILSWTSGWFRCPRNECCAWMSPLRALITAT